MVLPVEAVHLCKRLQGFATNTYRLETVGRNNAKSGSIVSFDLPSNSIVDLHSFRVFSTFSVNSSAKGVRIGSNPNLLINRCEVSCGGTNIDSSSSRMGRVIQALDIVDGCKNYKGIFRNFNHVTAASLAADADEDGEIVFAGIPGFLSAKDNRYLDTSLLPDLRVSLHLAGNDALSTCKNVDTRANFITKNPANSVSYELQNIYATVRTVMFSDSEAYNSMIASLMQSGMGLEIPYKSYYVTEDQHTSTTRTSVSSQSLDRVFALWPTHAGEVGEPCSSIKGYDGDFHLDGVAPQAEKYQGSYEVSNSSSFSTAKFQIRLNNCAFPQWEASLRDWYEMLPSKKCAQTFAQFVHNYTCLLYQFNVDEIHVSGVDTRSTNMSLVLESKGISSGQKLALIVECTSVLRIGVAKAFEVIH
eukprot:6213079-Pleurochrysis_carterae.AAC.1